MPLYCYIILVPSPLVDAKKSRVLGSRMLQQSELHGINRFFFFATTFSSILCASIAERKQREPSRARSPYCSLSFYPALDNPPPPPLKYLNRIAPDINPQVARGNLCLAVIKNSPPAKINDLSVIRHIVHAGFTCQLIAFNCLLFNITRTYVSEINDATLK